MMNMTISGPVQDLKSTIRPEGTIELEFRHASDSPFSQPIIVTVGPQSRAGSRDLVENSPAHPEVTSGTARTIRARRARWLVLTGAGVSLGVLLSTFLFHRDGPKDRTLPFPPGIGGSAHALSARGDGGVLEGTTRRPPAPTQPARASVPDFGMP
ncbi:hypothetical protein [Gluconacetobacter sacchari]|uniref:Uncharacterized protein n=2 Tax=Gluconacetobacter sacchari TaxID=92759 RepID=A0A7W4IEW7_9PROT|nr:hypothetical protein [Gluconacetobacter sacchari]MBB2161575.1 hypothetical protein [Gluconacetobacter sacchari]